MAKALATSAETQFRSQNYAGALESFQSLQSLGCDMCPLRQYTAQCYYHLGDYESAIREVDLGLEAVEAMELEDRRKEVYKQLAAVKCEILKAQNDTTEFRKSLELIRQNPYSGKLRRWAEETLKSLDSIDWSEVQQKLLTHAEYKEFSTHFQKEAHEGDLWHLIATQWIRRWILHLQGGPPPGPISNTAIIDNTPQRLVDSEPSKAYTNFRVRKNLTETEDFQVVPKGGYHFLVQKYSHDNTELRRYSIATNMDGSLTIVEVWLKRVQVLVGGEVKEVDISRKETVADLKEKVNRCIRCEKSIRLWKKKATETLQAAIDLLHRAESTLQPIIFSCGTLLDDNKEVENADIADEDILILEKYSAEKRWLLLPEHAETCRSCGRPGKLLICTGCRSVKYCSPNCQRTHYPMHKEVCKRKQKKGRAGLVGLQNLGNTCFMNSAIQCLSHTQPLTSYLLEDKHKAELNKKNPIGTGGKLVTAYVALLQDLWFESDPVQSPWELKRTIATFAPQFGGYQQHDSHELLSYLLDGIHEDLNRVLKKPYTALSEETGRSDAQVAREFWENHLKRNQSVIVDLMHGQYKSTLHCPQCGKVSVTFDPFLTCTLQIPNRDTKKCTFTYISLDLSQAPKELQCCLPLTTAMSEVKTLISDEFHVDKSDLITIAFEHKRFVGVAGDDIELSDLKQYDIVFYESRAKSLHPICLNITETTDDGVVRPALWPRVAFFRKDATAESIHAEIAKVAAQLLKTTDNRDFSVRIVNNTKVKKSYFMFQSRAPCKFCGEKECFNCPLPNTADLSLSALAKKVEDRLELELRCVRFVSRQASDIRVHPSANTNTGGKQIASLLDCLVYSSRPEVLSKENAWYCSTCKADVQATKTLQIYKSPEILILHMKRFRSRFFEKLNSMVEFPLEGLNLQDLVICPSPTQEVYDLYAVSNHYGSMLGGHYTAFVKAADRWYEMDDSSVREVRNLGELVTPAAYILFYHRRKSHPS